MNALKFNMVTGMIAYLMAGLTRENKVPEYLSDRLYLTFDNAMKCDELIMALYQQTQPCFEPDQESGYLAAVIIEDIQYIIMGSYEQWKAFYEMKWDYLLSECPMVISPN